MNAEALDLCRLAVRAPGASFDLAVPADVPLADLLPTLVEFAGPGLAEEGLEHGGWVLQRLGRPPLDEDRTPAQLGLRDGDLVHLRPRAAALPTLHYDDLVDGVADVLAERGGGWRPELTARLLLGLALGAVLAALAVVLIASGAGGNAGAGGFGSGGGGGGAGLRTGCAAGAALVLLVGALCAARALDDIPAATGLGAAAVPFTALAGWLVPHGPTGDALTGARLLACGAVAVGASALAAAAAGASGPLFTGLGTAGLLTACGGGAVLAGASPVGGAGVVAVAAVLVGAFVPGLAFWLSGLRMPPLPSDASELQQGIDPLPAAEVRDRTGLAQAFVTALFGALGLVCAVCAVPLALAGGGDGWAPRALAAALGLLLLLHTRSVGGMWQRLACVLPGAWAVLVAALAPALTSSSPSSDAGVTVGTVVGLLLAATALLLARWTVPGRRPLPHWGRAAELAQSLVAVALLPLLAEALHLFAWARGLNG